MTGPYVSVRGHHLFRPGLHPGICVVDLGVNHGEFRQSLLELVGEATFHGVEANPQLALQATEMGYATLQCVAVTDGAEANVRFNIALNDEGSSVLDLPGSSDMGQVAIATVRVSALSMEAVLSTVPGPIDVVKVDIEGAEVQALPTLSRHTLARVGQITVEFHRDEMFHFNLTERTRRAIAGLESRGFLALSFESNDTDVLFINRERFNVGRMTEWQLKAPLMRAVLTAHAKQATRGVILRLRHTARLVADGARRPRRAP